MINDVLKILTWVFYIVSLLGVLISIFLFFKLRIREVIQDLNGTLAKKQIEQMRERSIKGGERNIAQNIFDGGLGETGSMGRRKNAKTGPTGGTESTITSGTALNQNEISFKLNSLQNQISGGNEQNGTTVLKSNKVIDENFVLVKNIVYINTSETI